jgi:sulfur-oxidizing protein SoxY
MSGICFRTAAWVALAALACWSGVLAGSTAAESGDPTAGPWAEIASNVFHGRQLVDGSGLFALEMPARAEDAAIVPVTMRTTLPAGDARTLRAVTLIVDANPSPVAATFKVGSGVTMISTRVRVNSYTDVHAVAELSDGRLYMVKTYVKAAGGCSAPMASNSAELKATLGQMRFRQFATPKTGSASRLREAQIMIRHPNNSGLQRDQVSLLYIPLFIVRQLRIWQGDQVLLEMDGGISIAENPAIRFSYMPSGASSFRAEAVDTDGHVFKGEWPVQPAT